MAACLTHSAKARFAAIIAISALLCPTGRVAADVTTVGAVTPVPPVAGGTATSQLIVGAGSNETSSDIWGYVSVDDGTLLQYGTLIVGDNDGFFGQIDVSGNFLAGVNTELNFSGQGGGTGNPTVQIGNEGTGYLNVGGGSTMTLTNQGGDMSIGFDTTGVGYATITDQFTILTVADFLYVGQNGIGTLNVLNGAIVRTLGTGSSRFIGIGTEASGVGTVVVDGLGSSLRSGNSLVVSGNSTGTPTAYGQGTLRISNGAFVDVDNTTSARVKVGPWGRIELDGGTLIANTPSLIPIVPNDYGTAVNGYLGGSGLVRGSVFLGGGASTEANVGDVLRFDGIVSNQGSITVNGGEIRFLSDVTNNAAAGLDPAGRISLENGGTVRFSEPLTNEGVISNAHGTTNIHGKITNNGKIVVARDTVTTFYDDIMVPGSVDVLPGGNALFLANLTFTSAGAGAGDFGGALSGSAAGGTATLIMGVDPENPGGASSHVSVAGVATLGGTLVLSLEGGFSSLVGQTLNLITAGNVVGAFDSVMLPLVPNDLGVNLVYSPTGVSMQVNLISNGVPGDYNNDGTVDAADYTVWRDNLGSPNSLPNDDTPGVDQNDYTRWKTHFGEVAIVGSGAGSGLPASTPEPSGMALLLVASLAAMVLRGRPQFAG